MSYDVVSCPPKNLHIRSQLMAHGPPNYVRTDCLSKALSRRTKTRETKSREFAPLSTRASAPMECLREVPTNCHYVENTDREESSLSSFSTILVPCCWFSAGYDLPCMTMDLTLH